MLHLISLLCLALGAHSATAPFVKPCKPDDPACILSASRAALPEFVKGNPALGLKTLDPLHIDIIKSDHGGLNLVFKDSTLKGLKDCSIESVKHDIKKLKQEVTVKCNLVITGDYSLSGKLLILPINGKGKYKIDIRDVVLKAIIDLAIVDGADAKPHWHIKKWHHSFKVLTGTRFDFENLFNGDKALAEPVIEFANENWRDVMQEISPPVVHVIVADVINTIEVLYKAVPAEEFQV